MSVFKVGSNKSSQNNFPSVRPTLDLDFANSKTLDPRITFTRSSGGSYYGVDGLIKLAGVNEARFDHNQNTGESLGLLIEESRTNLVLRSQELATSPFTAIIGVVGGFTVTNNVTTSPDGTSNASQINSTSFTNGDSVYQDASATGNGTYTLSIFVKGGTCNNITFAAFFLYNSAQGFSFNYNPLTGTITGTGGGSNHTVVPYPNGWYRIYFTVTGTNALNTVLRFQVYTSATGITYLWGAQLEAGAFPTSYIPTVASTRTRAADNAIISGKNFSEWYRQDEGTIYSNVKYNARPISGIANRTNWVLKSALGIVWQLWWEATNTGALLNQKFGVIDASIFRSGAIISPGDQVKMASAFKTNNYAFSQAGGTAQTNSSVVLLNNYTELELGSVNQVSTNYLNGTISRLTYYPKRLTDAQLQVLTR